MALGACHTLPVCVFREKADDCRKARMPNADQLSHHSGSENIKMKVDCTARAVIICDLGMTSKDNPRLNVKSFKGPILHVICANICTGIILQPW